LVETFGPAAKGRPAPRLGFLKTSWVPFFPTILLRIVSLGDKVSLGMRTALEKPPMQPSYLQLFTCNCANNNEQMLRPNAFRVATPARGFKTRKFPERTITYTTGSAIGRMLYHVSASCERASGMFRMSTRVNLLEVKGVSKGKPRLRGDLCATVSNPINSREGRMSHQHRVLLPGYADHSKALQSNQVRTEKRRAENLPAFGVLWLIASVKRIVSCPSWKLSLRAVRLPSGCSHSR